MEKFVNLEDILLSEVMVTVGSYLYLETKTTKLLGSESKMLVKSGHSGTQELLIKGH
jgi:hypothetical protein